MERRIRIVVHEQTNKQTACYGAPQAQARDWGLENVERRVAHASSLPTSTVAVNVRGTGEKMWCGKTTIASAAIAVELR